MYSYGSAPALLTTTPNYGCTMKYYAGHAASSPTSRSWTSDAGSGRQPARPRAWHGQAVRSGSTSPRSAIERARELARAQGVRNVTFECADAQVHCFPQERFDLAMSRFGTMFFDDPVVAFANVGRALRPAGRLVMMVWQADERNEWEVAIRQSLAGTEGVSGRRFRGIGCVLARRSAGRDEDPGGRGVRRRRLH